MRRFPAQHASRAVATRAAPLFVQVAVLLVARVDSAQQFRRRGHALTAVEYSSALYRSLLPVPLWYNFFKEAPRGAPLLSTVCSGGGGRACEAVGLVWPALLRAASTRGRRETGVGLLCVPQSCPHPNPRSRRTSGVYLLLKCSSVYERFHAAGAALRQAASHSPYGCAPSQDDLAECGNSCPICQVGRAGWGVQTECCTILGRLKRALSHHLLRPPELSR